MTKRTLPYSTMSFESLRDRSRKSYQEMLAKGTLTLRTPAVIKRIHKLRKDKPSLQKGTKNCNAKAWRLRSPLNVVYTFRNLLAFIRDNPSLFAPEDVQWKKSAKQRSESCRASGGLAMLCPSRKNTKGSWKGWRWDSQLERLGVLNLSIPTHRSETSP